MSHNAKGSVFIVFEGIDGAGKTTQLNRLYDHLTEQGIEAVKTREPGGTPVAETLRSCMLGLDNETISPMTELLMVYAARQQHLDHVIRPALAAGKWVLCDRFTDTTFAYQIRGRQLAPELFHELNRLIVRDTKPDATIFFNLDDETYQRRLKARTGKQDRLDLESEKFTKRVVAGLKERAHYGGHLIVNAEASIDLVTQRMLQVLSSRITLPEKMVEEARYVETA